MKVIMSNANVSAPVNNRLYETYILNPIRMGATSPSAVHAIFAPDMPDIVAKIKSHEKFYKNQRTRYDIEPVVLFKEFPNQGYTVCTILLDDDAQYDSDMLERAISRICNRCGDKTTFRLAKNSDVLSEADWKRAMTVLDRHGSNKGTIELYINISIEQKTCENCAHHEVCKFVFMNKPQPNCKFFLQNTK